MHSTGRSHVHLADALASVSGVQAQGMAHRVPAKWRERRAMRVTVSALAQDGQRALLPEAVHQRRHPPLVAQRAPQVPAQNLHSIATVCRAQLIHSYAQQTIA